MFIQENILSLNYVKQMYIQVSLAKLHSITCKKLNQLFKNPVRATLDKVEPYFSLLMA